MKTNKEKLLIHIAASTVALTEELIKLIIDDEYWLGELGIQKADAETEKSVSDLIKAQLSNPEKEESIDLLLRYAIGDYLMDEANLPLVRHEVSADSYGTISALFVYKCSEIYFCYFYSDSIEALITEDPEEFCCAVATKIKENYEMEEENLKDDWFKDSDPYNNLHWNFNFKEE